MNGIKFKKIIGNKGFSLVELIIVIAIMAILSAIIAPAVIRYINKARKADDIAAADSIGTSFEAAITENEALYDFITYRVSHERGSGSQFVVIGFTGYGHGLSFHTMKPAGVSNDLYNTASVEFDRLIGEYMGERTRSLPLKFYMQNELDQWIICADKNYKLYVFVRGHLTDGSSWYIKNDNRVNGSQQGSLYCYRLWPTVDPKYNSLNTPKDVLLYH